MPTYTSLSAPARRPRTLSGALCIGALVAGSAVALLPWRSAAAQLPAAAAAAAREPATYTELWQAAAVAVDQGEFERNDAVRTALYAKATAYARRAVALNPGDAEGHFHLSRAVGRTALALGPRERVKLGIEVREQALAALKLSPRHPGALHVMGVWNAEIMRLNGIARTVAKAASWSEAVRYLELAVQVEPERLVHRLDLARIYRDLERTEDARAAYRAAVASADFDPNDRVYRQQATEELRRLK
jgi:tetratricopeptide (TPR) repeat protein